MAPNQRPRTAPPTRRPRVAGRPSPTRRTPDTPAGDTQPPDTADTAATTDSAQPAPAAPAPAEPSRATAPATDTDTDSDTAESAATEPKTPRPATAEATTTPTTTAAATGAATAAATGDDHAAAEPAHHPADTADDRATTATEAADDHETAVALPAETADDTETVRDTWTREPATGPTRRPRPAPREGAPTGRRRGADEVLAYPPQSEVSRPATRTATAGRRANPYLLPVVLIVVAVLLGAFAAFAASRASGYGDVDTANRALADDSATRTVLQQTTTALNTLFSFDYRNPDKTRTDSANLTTSQIGGTYQQLMSVLRDQGPRNQLSLSSAVLTSGVERLQGTKASVLALLSQTYSKGTGPTARQSPVLAMVRVDLTQTGGTWKVANLTLLSS